MSEILLKVALNTENLLLVYLSDWYAVSHFRLIDAVLKSSEHYFRYINQGKRKKKTKIKLKKKESQIKKQPNKQKP
jgi:hypothetical protein